MTLTEIKKQFGEQGLTNYATVYGGIGKITDDTQMTLFVAEGLLRTAVLSKMQGLCSTENIVNHALMRWLLTQARKPKCEVGTDGWLYQVPELHAVRAPGITCITALKAKTSLSDLYASNDSKGCGGVMRVAPVGLVFTGKNLGEEISKAFELGSNLARLTHGHPCSTMASGVMAVLVLQLVAGTSLQEAIYLSVRQLDTHDDSGIELCTALNTARLLASKRVVPEDAIPQLGQGWVAEEALSISVYSCLYASSLEGALLIAINHDGDSDSTGSITGSLMGAWRGVDAIPEHWLERLELREVIQTIADDLLNCGSWDLNTHEPTPESERILNRYPAS